MKTTFWSPVLLLSLAAHAVAYDVGIEDKDYERQFCSGMWANDQTYINVTFDGTSQGHVAMVIYEWKDAPYLGRPTPAVDDNMPPRTYVCTASAVQQSLCTKENLGKFILDLPSGKTINDTSFWSALVKLPATVAPTARAEDSSFWNNPAGNPPAPSGGYSSAWRRFLRFTPPPTIQPYVLPRNQNIERRNDNPSPTEAPYVYDLAKPIHYTVKKQGYYCVAILPLTSLNSTARRDIQHVPRADSDASPHPRYTGNVHFQNTFQGKLAASDYPKVTFYLILTLIYVAFGGVWGWMCWRHYDELQPIQHYLSLLTGLLPIEMLANYAYYRYLNAHGKGTGATVFLIVVAILDALRNSLSFFLLLIVCLGLSVVRPSLGKTMIRAQALAGGHFIFGILYAIGIVELELESTSALILLLFVIPLAFTLSGFLLWIMYSLNATILHLRTHKQHYKLSIFTALNRILTITVCVIGIFFVVSTWTFSARGAEDYSASSWATRWWLLDGWLALLYLVSFGCISYLWRPSEHNSRLAMSDELAQDEEDAEDYDLDNLEGRPRLRTDDDETLVGESGYSRGTGGRAPGQGPNVGEDAVVFEIGDEDDFDDDDPRSAVSKKGRGGQRLSGEERRGLVGRDRDD